MNIRIKKKRYKLLKSQDHTHFYINEYDAWNCDDTIAKFLRDLLRKFKKYNIGYPDQKFKSYEEYDNKLKELIEICDNYSNKRKYENTDPKKYDKIHDDYREMFHQLAELIFDLWW